MSGVIMDLMLTQDGVDFLNFVADGGRWIMSPGYSLTFRPPNQEEVILAEALSRFAYIAEANKGFFPFLVFSPASPAREVISPLVLRRLETLGYITRTLSADQAAILKTMKDAATEKRRMAARKDRLGLSEDEDEDT